MQNHCASQRLVVKHPGEDIRVAQSQNYPTKKRSASLCLLWRRFIYLKRTVIKTMTIMMKELETKNCSNINGYLQHSTNHFVCKLY